MQGGDSTAYTVKAVSDWAGITIRTLHHYDAIGLLKPAQVTEMYRGLGDLYVQDPRFTARYEEIKPGMARFMQAAIQAYCDRLEGR